MRGCVAAAHPCVPAGAALCSHHFGGFVVRSSLPCSANGSCGAGAAGRQRLCGHAGGGTRRGVHAGGGCGAAAALLAAAGHHRRHPAHPGMPWHLTMVGYEPAQMHSPCRQVGARAMVNVSTRTRDMQKSAGKQTLMYRRTRAFPYDSSIGSLQAQQWQTATLFARPLKH